VSQQEILAVICTLSLTASGTALAALLFRLPRRFDASGAGALTLNQAFDRNYLGLPAARSSGTLWWLLGGGAALVLFWGLLARSALDSRSLTCALNALVLLVSVLMFGRRLRRLHDKAAASRAAIEEAVGESHLLLFSWQLLVFFGFNSDANGAWLVQAPAAGLFLLLMAQGRLKRFRIVCGLFAFLLMGLVTLTVSPFGSDRPSTLAAALRWQAGVTILATLATIHLLLRRAPREAEPRTSSRRRPRPAVHA